MTSLSHHPFWTRTDAPVLVRVLGPDSEPLAPRDLERLFAGQTLTPARRKHLANSPRLVAICNNAIVGLAVFERTEFELRVYEFALDRECPCTEVAGSLLDALEVACLAGGGRRLVLTPRAAAAAADLRKHGYQAISEGCAGAWFEKNL